MCRWQLKNNSNDRSKSLVSVGILLLFFCNVVLSCLRLSIARKDRIAWSWHPMLVFLYIFFSTLQLRQTHTDTIYYYMNMSRRDIQTCGRQYIFAKKSNSSWNMFVLLSTVRMSTRIHKYTRIRAGTQSHKPDRHYVHNRYY